MGMPLRTRVQCFLQPFIPYFAAFSRRSMTWYKCPFPWNDFFPPSPGEPPAQKGLGINLSESLLSLSLGLQLQNPSL